MTTARCRTRGTGSTRPPSHRKAEVDPEARLVRALWVTDNFMKGDFMSEPEARLASARRINRFYLRIYGEAVAYWELAAAVADNDGAFCHINDDMMDGAACRFELDANRRLLHRAQEISKELNHLPKTKG